MDSCAAIIHLCTAGLQSIRRGCTRAARQHLNEGWRWDKQTVGENELEAAAAAPEDED